MARGPIPRDTIGELWQRSEPTEQSSGMRRQAFLGTCFALWHRDYFLTAEHCLGRLGATDLFVYGAFGGVSQPRPVAQVYRHENADIAVLRCPEMKWGIVTPFPKVRAYDNLLLGEEFYSYGYPVGALTLEDEESPVRRAFHGRLQRYFHHEASIGGRQYRYQAGELSIAAPTGLSGGPVFSTRGEVEVFGLVAHELKVANLLDEYVEEEANGHIRESQRFRVICYGVAVLLDPIVGWLTTVIPRTSD